MKNRIGVCYYLFYFLCYLCCVILVVCGYYVDTCVIHMIVVGVKKIDFAS